MSQASSKTVNTSSLHRIAANRSLDTLLRWASGFLEEEVASGRKVIFAPCHALRGAVSLKSWILTSARRALGSSAPEDTPTLLSGAADTLVIADPASGDPGSLRWLADLLECADIAREVSATPPMPKVVLLVPIDTTSRTHVDNLIMRLNALGCEDIAVSGRRPDASIDAIETEIGGLRVKYESLLAALSLMPCPLGAEMVENIAKAARAGAGALDAVTSGDLYRVVGGYVVPANSEVVTALRGAFDDETCKSGAKLLQKVVKDKLADVPDAQVDIQLRATDGRSAVALARKRFTEHYADNHAEEGLRILRVARELGHNLAVGEHADVTDLARLAAMLAEVGEYDEAQRTVEMYGKDRSLFPVQPFIEWIAQAARTLAIRHGYDPKAADSLMRRAVRMNKKDSDEWVRLRLLRVEFLRSRIFNLQERADWLLSHVNNKILDKLSPSTLAAFLDEMASRLFAQGNYKGAFKRLRRLGALPAGNERLARAMLLMARCRQHFKDHEAAARYGNSALQYSIRAAKPRMVEDAVKFLRALEKDRPRRLPRIAPPAKSPTRHPRLPAAADLPTPQSAEASQLFEILEARFDATYWMRRRRGEVEIFGDEPGESADDLSVFQEMPDGAIKSLTRSGQADGNERGVVLLRANGDDVVMYSGEGESRDDSIVQFLLTDSQPGDDKETVAPSRKSVIDEYMRQALDQGIKKRGLHYTMENLFNKDVLIFFEEQGFSKEEMAEKIGVSRATLYRMYVRAGLN